MSSFWDEFKKIFQTKQQREQERAKKLHDALKKESAISEKLQELDESYKASLPQDNKKSLDELFPTSLNLEKIDYNAPTDEKIAAQAESELLASLESEKQKILDKLRKEQQNVASMKDSVSEDAQESIMQLDRLYESLKDKAEKDALKRGLGRSSIVSEQLKDFDVSKAESNTQIQKQLLKSISDANMKLVSLEEQKDNALNLLDIKHASDLQKRISQLSDEREALILKYKKHNDEVEKKQQEFELTRQKQIDAYLKDEKKKEFEEEKNLYEHEKAYGYSGDKLKNYSERYDIALDFYNSLSPDIAADALAASPNMKFYLGIYYDKLMSLLKNKSAKTTSYF